MTRILPHFSVSCAFIIIALLATMPHHTSASTLQEGSPVTGQLGSRESHVIDIDLLEDQFVELEIIAKDFAFKLQLVAPARGQSQEALHKRYGRMIWRFIARETGKHQIVISSLEMDPSPRQYQINMNESPLEHKHHKMAAQAAEYFYRAEGLRFNWQHGDLLRALELYEAAAVVWQEQFSWADAANAWQCIGEAHFIQGDYGKALRAYERALRLSWRANDITLTCMQLNNIGYVHVYLGNIEKAASLFEQVQAHIGKIPAELPSRKPLEARLLNNVGEVEYGRGDLKRAVDLFNNALSLWGEIGDRGGIALAHLNAAYCFVDSGNVQEASSELQQALARSQETDDRRGEAQTLTALGNLYALLGQRQAALTAHHKARNIFRSIGDRQGEAVTLNGLGDVYESLNLKQAAIDSYFQALRLNREIGNKDFEAVSSYYLGGVYSGLNDLPNALKYLGYSYDVSRRSQKTRMATLALTDIATIYVRQKRLTDALRIYKQSLAFYNEIGDLRRQALTLCYFGELYRARGNHNQAIAEYRRALALFRRIKDPQGEAETLYWTADLLREQGRLKEALAESEKSINLIETGRAQVMGQNWRSSYFAAVRRHYELHVDILMRLSEQFPESGFARSALRASERARARSLLEQLVETQSEIRLGVAPALLSRERQLQGQLSAKAAYLTRLLSATHSDVEAAEAERAIRELSVEYDYVQSQIRAQSPAYGRLTQPHTLSSEEIQSAFSEDENTVLIEYMLGDKHSYVWVVSADTIVVRQLEGRQRLEALAKQVYEEITARQLRPGEKRSGYNERVAQREQQFYSHAAQLSQAILDPIRHEMKAERLLIVPDGLLHYIPFDVLPLPGAEEQSYTPLITRFEVVVAPSFSSLILLRQLRAASSGRKRGIAVWADPVYEFDDPRVEHNRTGPDESPADASGYVLPEARQLEKQFFTDNNISPSRLLATLAEAKNIEQLAAGDVRLMTGFAADRESVVEADLRDYSILHFATHGMISDRHSWLSGLLLSTVDWHGGRRNGLLQLHEIYNLRLEADLVVLSACQTALGKQLSGEGFVGLTQGFLYAGSRSVVASLWKVDDKAAELMMTSFYRAMLEDGLAPAAALRRAKLEMYYQTHYYSPYFWGSFVIQGEYRPVSGAWSIPRPVHPLVIAAAALAALCSAAYIVRKLNRRARNKSAG